MAKAEQPQVEAAEETAAMHLAGAEVAADPCLAAREVVMAATRLVEAVEVMAERLQAGSEAAMAVTRPAEWEVVMAATHQEE